MAFLIEAKVSSASAALVGGPAWTFNGMTQSVLSQYPKGGQAIKQFSIDIAGAELAAIKQDPNNPGQYIVPNELQVYDAAISVWNSKNLAGVSPPALMKAVRLWKGECAAAYNAAAHNSGVAPTAIAVGAVNDPAALYAESQRYNGEAIVYSLNGLCSVLAKGGTVLPGVIGDSIGLTRSGKFIIDLLNDPLIGPNQVKF